MTVDETLICQTCQTFKVPTQDNKGALCPQGHGRVTMHRPSKYGSFADFYREQAKLHALLPWLAKFGDFYEDKYGYRLKGASGIFKKGRKLKELSEHAGFAAKKGLEVFAFTRIAHDGYVPLSRLGGSIKDWQGSLIEGPIITDGRIIVDTIALDEPTIKRFAKVQANKRVSLDETLKAKIDNILQRSPAAAIFGVQDEVLFASAGGTTYRFKADFCAFLNRKVEPDEFALKVAGKDAWLQFVVEGTVVAAVAERTN